jgi:hypothetical protein
MRTSMERAERYWEGRWRTERAENERLLAVVRAIDEPEPGKPTAWRYRRDELAEMARDALSASYTCGEPAEPAA